MSGRTQGAARAVADLSAGTIVATVDLDVPPERVFAALSTAEVAQWWGSAETYRVTDWTMDLRPGGAWTSVGVGADGKPFSVSGEVLEVDPPRRLGFTWRYGWGDGGVTTVRYTVEPRGAGGSRLTVRHSGFGERVRDCEDHATGWERILGWLAGHIEPASG